MSIEHPIITDDLEPDVCAKQDDCVDIVVKKKKSEKPRANFYFFCQTLNGTVHGDTCEKNRKLLIPRYHADKCLECSGIPEGTKKIPQLEYHAQVEADIMLARRQQSNTARVPYTAKNQTEFLRIYQSKEK